jgi:hypothetical protein
MIVTREVINKNISFIDIGRFPKSYSYADLCFYIDHIKYILINEYNCKRGESVLIGLSVSTLQIAAFFACAELGLQVIILDHSRDDDWISTDYVDPKTKSLMPLNYYIVEQKTINPDILPRHNFFKSIADNSIVLNFRNFDKNKNPAPSTPVIAEDNDILLKCTSSGTTGTAKIVKHTHKFLNKLILRNKSFFYGSVCMIMNLNHGSSPATYFLPALCSENTTHFISCKMQLVAGYKQTKTFVPDFKELGLFVDQFDIKHLMLPYTHLIKLFFDKGVYPGLTLYTLSTIQKSWLDYYNNGNIKNIISFFGCNETSGPLLINEIKDADFSESRYKLYDDFYRLNVNEGKNLEVTMPVYDINISTNDMFDIVNGYFYHKGRNDLYRVNGSIVDLPEYNSRVTETLNAIMIVDTVKDSLYLAIWEHSADYLEKIDQLNARLLRISKGSHKVDKFAILDQNKFYTGVKLDMELLRDYFRNYVE